MGALAAARFCQKQQSNTPSSRAHQSMATAQVTVLARLPQVWAKVATQKGPGEGVLRATG